MKNKLAYITYQSFPADTANSLQTIYNICTLVEKKIDVTLIFPNREFSSSENISDFKNFYNFHQDFKIQRLNHYLPFGRTQKFKKITFHVSHFLWSAYAVKKINKNYDVFLTRSDWVFLFLSLLNRRVIFECHKKSKIRNFVLFLSLKKANSKIIFLNHQLKNNYQKYLGRSKNYLVLQNGYFSFHFDKKSVKENKIVFIGELFRFGSPRNIEFLINAFQNEKLKKYELVLIGGPNNYVVQLKNENIKDKTQNIKFMGRLSHVAAIEEMLSSRIGILINTSKDSHSYLHTSPLKYFEYLASELKIVAVDFPSHRALPFSENISFFTENDTESFIKAVENTAKIEPVNFKNYSKYSLDSRIQTLIEFARLEGLEPPTL